MNAIMNVMQEFIDRADSEYDNTIGGICKEENRWKSFLEPTNHQLWIDSPIEYEDEESEDDESEDEDDIEDQDDFTNRICENPACNNEFDLSDPHYYDEEESVCYCCEECYKNEDE